MQTKFMLSAIKGKQHNPARKRIVKPLNHKIAIFNRTKKPLNSAVFLFIFVCTWEVYNNKKQRKDDKYANNYTYFRNRFRCCRRFKFFCCQRRKSILSCTAPEKVSFFVITDASIPLIFSALSSSRHFEEYFQS